MNETRPINRIAIVDFIRGMDVIAMIIYHLIWDLFFFGFIIFNIQASKIGLLFQTLIVAIFLILVGYSLRITMPSFRSLLKRVVKIGFCALLISLFTYIFYKEYWIYFGILHCILVSMLMVYPFLWYPKTSLFLAIAIGLIYGFGIVESCTVIRCHLKTLDYYPVYPYIAFVFLGIFLGYKQVHDYCPLYNNENFRPILWIGQNALWVYMIHQPILFALLYIVKKTII
ncbi:TPA: DUF1624 domain-containing protein [Legionella pneumophila]|nr:heparan-alpha-glucosaminide N-acetyltransferase [Legionella pneumophila]HAT8869572.1 DUF1624 domain-containing protein [Legionella pneumophila subsp. pneumophila]HAT7074291.1 DUF1624 domain-containing protein [Legionella pneumophila]HAT8643177.1 DUF1624 domain-containing protein [Legionella pneumophila]HAT8891313.1 DUF1624 domain-containing protein [Legionella pneumophila subsp. pneumophila]HAT8934786.1 DUF1624 domain-containing protein [Legionella pneumophila subsp. pneumophila]